MKKLKINSNWLLLVLALALGGGAAFLGNRMVQGHMAQLDEQARRMHEPVAVVVAKQDLAPGDVISSEHFAVRKIPAQYANADAVRPDGFKDLQGQRLAVPLKRGDSLFPVHVDGQGAQVFSATLKNGRRAMTFEVDTINSVSGMLRPGDHIDLMLSQRDSGAGAQELTRPLLSDLRVLATDQSVVRRDEETGKERAFSTITLDLSPQEAQRIIVAKSAGRLTALLRHPDDRALNPTQALAAAGLFEARGGAAGGSAIEYLVGGGGGMVNTQHQANPLAQAKP